MANPATQANPATGDAATFRPQQKQQQGGVQQEQAGYWGRGNFNNRPAIQNRGSNTSRNGKFCAYCKILNHTQQECRKRIRDNKPCVNNKGQLFWPKINPTSIDTNSVHSNSDPNNEVGSVFQ